MNANYLKSKLVKINLSKSIYLSDRINNVVSLKSKISITIFALYVSAISSVNSAGWIRLVRLWPLIWHTFRIRTSVLRHVVASPWAWHTLVNMSLIWRWEVSNSLLVIWLLLWLVWHLFFVWGFLINYNFQQDAI